MLVNFDKTGRVIWYNLYVSKEAAESCLSDNTIWLDASLQIIMQGLADLELAILEGGM